MENGKTYILTCALGSKVKAIRQLGLKTPGERDPFFTEFQTEMVKRIENSVPGCEVMMLPMDELADTILSKALSLKSKLKEALVVSSCAEIAVPRRGCILEINRLVDEKGEILGLGPRPGTIPLNQQIGHISRVCDGRSVVLMEDGSFTGSTLSFIIDEFAKFDTRIAAVVVGFIFPAAKEKILNKLQGDLVEIAVVNDIVDWMPDYDFVPFVPNCGRPLGVKLAKNVYPFYSLEGASYSFPYLSTFAPISDWASIPKLSARAFSLFCLQKTLELFELLEKTNNAEIKIGDLVSIMPRISVPICVGDIAFPKLDTGVTEYLHEVCHDLL
jgi:hypothetical protein